MKPDDVKIKENLFVSQSIVLNFEKSLAVEYFARISEGLLVQLIFKCMQKVTQYI